MLQRSDNEVLRFWASAFCVFGLVVVLLGAVPVPGVSQVSQSAFVFIGMTTTITGIVALSASFIFLR